MKNTTFHRSFAARALLATALAAAAWGAQAASGFTVQSSQESLIKVGMSQEEVRQALGRPQEIMQFANEPGPTWTYEVADALEPAIFDVDFGTDGRVASVDERPLPDRD